MRIDVQVQQISVKLPADRTLGFEQSAYIPIFHRWIRERVIADRLLIDVADYRHVPEGPGVMLIAHEGQFALDEGGGRLGLRWSRKRDEPGQLADRLREAWKDVATAASLLLGEPTSPLTFSATEIEIQIHSRLYAPNTDDSYELLVPAIRQVAAEVFGAEVNVDRLSHDEREAFGVRVTAGAPAGIESQLERL